ncbi:MAG: broad-spectrum mercury transporter MerE [Xanthomonadales bacterium]|nr:broad-spectrum mercury transporter MerE [Xanthomonadales bacterium]
MSRPTDRSNETRKSLAVYLWRALAAVTCPCHAPILAAVLAGTTAGAFISQYWGVAALAMTSPFVMALLRLFRAARRNV